ncbi:MAG: response regulator [Candidatus Thermoplasmatota archaeon]|nr:response regulator [Candidatus Thermoplasmatota archaeon]MEC8789049.1 response regulator [Candidatus Thermoplasmatota archaeon]
MPKLIVADENEGRRNLLAGTLERAGYDVTRAGTLRQAEGTALATMPEIVLIDGEWKTGDAIDASQRLMSDPEFAFKCRIVILSRNVSEDYLVSAARASVNEVIPKPVDMNKLLAQLEKHSRKQFVPPPAEVSNAAAGGGGGSFDVSMVMSDGKWALPMLKGIVTPEKINVDFINEILGQLGEEGIEVEEGLDPSLMSNILRVALNSIVGDLDSSNQGDASGGLPQNLPSSRKSATLGSKSSPMKVSGSSMEEILQKQADGIADEIEGIMDGILDEKPDMVTLLPNRDQVVIDPAVLKFTRLVAEQAHELMWDIGRPGNVSDLTLRTRIEDITEMLGDVISSLPEGDEEE